MDLITPTLKDAVLRYLCETHLPETAEELNTELLLSTLDIPFHVFNAVSEQFKRLGLLGESTFIRRSTSRIVLRIEATDALMRGGFVAQEDLLKSNINKLLFETENLRKELEPKHLETANRMAGIASAILAALALIR